MYRIGYNIELGCWILSNLKAKYNDYDLALTAYNHGEYSEVFKTSLTNDNIVNEIEYVRKVMGQ